MSDKEPKNRRDFIVTATTAAGVVGVGAAVWPLVDQMNPDASVKALASTEVDISSVKPGQSITLNHFIVLPIIFARRVLLSICLFF